MRFWIGNLNENEIGWLKIPFLDSAFGDKHLRLVHPNGEVPVSCRQASTCCKDLRSMQQLLFQDIGQSSTFLALDLSDRSLYTSSTHLAR